MPKIKPPLSARELFASNLRLVRKIKDLSQEAVANDAGLARSHLSRIEHAQASPTIDAMEAIANAVDVSLRDLLDPEFLASLARLK